MLGLLSINNFSILLSEEETGDDPLEGYSRTIIMMKYPLSLPGDQFFIRGGLDHELYTGKMSILIELRLYKFRVLGFIMQTCPSDVDPLTTHF